MADNTPDNSTDWIGFAEYGFRRAIWSPFKSFPEVERIIEQVTLEEVFSGKRGIRWLDYSGHEHVGVPFGCGSAFGFTSPYHYDPSADALKPRNRYGLVGTGPVLYRPQVRERVRPVNDNQTIDVALRPTASEASDTARVDVALPASEAADSVQVEGTTQSDVVLTADGVTGPIGSTGPIEEPGLDGVTGPTASSVHAHDRWIWQVDPGKLAKDGSVPRQAQLACE